MNGPKEKTLERARPIKTDNNKYSGKWCATLTCCIWSFSLMSTERRLKPDLSLLPVYKSKIIMNQRFQFKT